MTSKSAESVINTANLEPVPDVMESVTNTNNVLKSSKQQANMQWWFLAPVVLAIVMFLLVGTIFERRIEGVWRHITERRQEMLQQTTETQESTSSFHSMDITKTSAQRSTSSLKMETTTSTAPEPKLESKSYTITKKELKENIVHKDDVFLLDNMLWPKE